MAPANGETPQIDWPVIALGEDRLIVRWTFYVQWLLSKRKVNVRDLGALMVSKDPAIVDVMVECFAAAVAENFTSRGLPAPTAEHWALAVSKAAAARPGVWNEVNRTIWAAVGKVQPTTATPAAPADAQPGTTTTLN